MYRFHLDKNHHSYTSILILTSRGNLVSLNPAVFRGIVAIIVHYCMNSLSVLNFILNNANKDHYQRKSYHKNPQN